GTYGSSSSVLNNHLPLGSSLDWGCAASTTEYNINFDQDSLSGTGTFAFDSNDNALLVQLLFVGAGNVIFTSSLTGNILGLTAPIQLSISGYEDTLLHLGGKPYDRVLV